MIKLFIILQTFIDILLYHWPVQQGTSIFYCVCWWNRKWDISKHRFSGICPSSRILVAARSAESYHQLGTLKCTSVWANTGALAVHTFPLSDGLSKMTGERCRIRCRKNGWTCLRKHVKPFFIIVYFMMFTYIIRINYSIIKTEPVWSWHGPTNIKIYAWVILVLM